MKKVRIKDMVMGSVALTVFLCMTTYLAISEIYTNIHIQNPAPKHDQK